MVVDNARPAPRQPVVSQRTMERGGSASWMKYGPVVSLFVVILALWFRAPQDESLDDRLDTVLSSLLRAERKVGMDGVSRPKVAIGEWWELANVSPLAKLIVGVGLSVIN